MDLLLGHPWPRNYIELRQVLQRASATTEEGVMRARDVREALDREGAARFSSLDTPSETSSIDLLRPLREIERDIVRMVVEKYARREPNHNLENPQRRAVRVTQRYPASSA